MKKIFFSLVLTIVLGPGVGHLYLRKIKKAIFLIVLSLVFAFHQIWQVIEKSGITDIAKLDQNQLATAINTFSTNFPRLMFYYDAIFAAIWAYALIDVFMISREEYKVDNENSNNPKDENS